MDLEELKQLVADGYVRVSKHPTIPLYIYNYTSLTEFEENWTDITRKCRGLVLDENGNIIINCIPKFFNQEQKFAAKLGSDLEITEKNDGYMIQIQRNEYLGLEDDMLVTSRGSFDNQYVDKAKEFIKGHEREFEPDYTYICELCCNFSGDEGIIVTKHPIPKLVCFAMINDEGEEIPLEDLPSCLERVKSFTSDEMSEYLNKEVEGVVLKDQNNNRVKVKTEWFLERHRIISDCTEKRAWEVCRNYTDIAELNLPDELLDKMEMWCDNQYFAHDQVLKIVEHYVDNMKDLPRKDLAISSGIPKIFKGLIFDVLDGKHERFHENLWKMLKP